MARREWSVKLEDGTHSVALEHGFWGGRRVVTVDGNEVMRARRLIDTGSIHAFDLGRHACYVVIASVGLAFRYDLVVDGISQATGKAVLEPLPVPVWGWVFVALCAAIPLVTLGGAVPALIGYIGGAGCYQTSRDPRRSVHRRLLICAAYTVAVWLVFGVYIFVGVSLSV